MVSDLGRRVLGSLDPDLRYAVWLSCSTVRRIPVRGELRSFRVVASGIEMWERGIWVPFVDVLKVEEGNSFYLLGLWQVTSEGLRVSGLSWPGRSWWIEFKEGVWVVSFLGGPPMWSCVQLTEAMAFVLRAAAAWDLKAFWPELFPWQKVLLRRHGFVV